MIPRSIFLSCRGGRGPAPRESGPAASPGRESLLSISHETRRPVRAVRRVWHAAYMRRWRARQKRVRSEISLANALTGILGFST
jgi:hypothetical protein